MVTLPCRRTNRRALDAYLLFSNKPLGASTAYARLAGMFGLLIAPKHTRSLKYFKENKPIVDWEVMLVFGESQEHFSPLGREAS